MYLSSFKYDDVTILNLLNHTSGLPADLPTKEILSRDEVLKIIYNIDKVYDTSKGFVYSDLDYFY